MSRKTDDGQSCFFEIAPEQDAEYMDANKDIAVDKGATLKKRRS